MLKSLISLTRSRKNLHFVRDKKYEKRNTNKVVSKSYF